MPRKRNVKTTPTPTLHCLQPNAAGVDVGATQIYIAIPAERDPQSVRCFPTFTEDLHAAADWLQSCLIDTVAMESTGVYWIPFFQVLEARGFKVFLVNARHVKNVPGRKQMLKIANGYSISTRWGCSAPRFAQNKRCATCDRFSAIGTA